MLVGMTFMPTQEQRLAEEAFLSGESLRIEALAGCGKSTTLRYLTRGRRGGKILYTSFGAKVIQDAKGTFPPFVRVATNHALAWGIGRHYQNAGRLRPRVAAADVVRHFGWGRGIFAPYTDPYGGAHACLEAVARFCHSGDKRLTSAHALAPAVRRAGKRGDAEVHACARLFSDYAAEIWDEMCDPDSRLPVTHDVYLKRWALTEPHLPYDTILLDEAQDANGVLLSVLAAQDHAQLVLVGDRNQQIFTFRGAVNALERIPVTRDCRLTQSFRFGPEIAELANLVLADQCHSPLLLQGDPHQPGRVGAVDEPDCVLARKNATLINHLFTHVRARPGAKVCIQGGVSELVGLLDSAERLQAGQPATHPELAEFTSWAEVKEGCEDEHYAHLRTFVELASTHGIRALREMLEQSHVTAGAGVLTLSTAHKAKGAEWGRVKLLDDFPLIGPADNPGLFGWEPEAANLLYVAATRARRELDVEDCAAIQQARAQSVTGVLRVRAKLAAGVVSG